MAGKLLPLNEAATLLGVTPDELNEMRLRQEIYGYRDGSSWKFKTDDLERVKEERAAAQEGPLTGGDEFNFADDLAGEPAGPSDTGLPVDFGEGTNETDEVVLLSELELGASGPSTSSTIIGRSSKQAPPEDSDLKLAGDEVNISDPDEIQIGAGASDLGFSEVEPGSDVQIGGHNSDVELVPLDENVLDGGSDLPNSLSESATVVKSGGGANSGGGSGGGSNLGLGDSVLLAGGSGGGSSSLARGTLDSGLSLSSNDDEISLTGGLGSDVGSGSDSTLQLSDEDVLSGGSGSGSDLTHRPSDSGILLIDPADSGLSLEKPVDLGGSDPSLATTDYSSELGEMKGDDDFLLTPLEEASEDESDSGSQVIMLDTEGEFEDATATLLASQIPGMGGGPALEEESGFGGMGGDAPAPVSRAGASAGAATMYVARPEARFSALTVLGLTLCAVALTVTGIMVFDVVRNMWSWDNPYGVNSILISNFYK